MTIFDLRRPSDKHIDRELQIIRTDSDIAIGVCGIDPHTDRFTELFSVSFSNRGSRSPKTYQALLALIEAMKEDEISSPHKYLTRTVLCKNL